MEIKLLLVVVGLVCIGTLDAHPHPYPESRFQRSIWTPDNLPPILSYHIHCVFQNGDKSIVNSALDLHDRFITRFNLNNTEECETLYKNDRLCMFDIEEVPTRGSPFLSGNWAVFVPLENFLETTRWIQQNRGDLSIFIHPNSGAERSDHSIWALWGGAAWPLNLSAFRNQTY